MKKSKQPKASYGIYLIGASIFFFALFFFVVVSAPNSEYTKDMTALYWVTGLPAFGFLIWGIVILVNHTKSYKAGQKGTDATCTVLRKKCLGHRGGGVDFFVTVEFTSEKTGHAMEHEAVVTEGFYVDVKEGDLLECRVLGDSCYLDPEQPRFAVTIEEEF